MKTFFNFIRILDEDGKLSITNIFMYVLVLSTFISFSINPIIAIGTFVLYGFGRFLNFKRGQAVTGAMKTLFDNQVKMQQQIKEMGDRMTAVQMKAGISQSGLTDLTTRMNRFNA